VIKPAVGSWHKVEKISSYCLLVVLASFIGTRLAFADVWQLPKSDLVLSILGLLLVLGGFWFARNSRAGRIGIIAFATATQVVPMVFRQPVLLFPLIGASIPIGILLGCLVALSRKNATVRQSHRS